MYMEPCAVCCITGVGPDHVKPCMILLSMDFVIDSRICFSMVGSEPQPKRSASASEHTHVRKMI